MTDLGGQREVIAFLRSGQGKEIRTVTTHASIIFLTGTRAFKLKRAVQFPFLDFSTPERRLRFCRQELALNRRTAPALYLGVRVITREADGRLTFDGSGILVDAVVEMRRFDDRNLLDNLALNGSLTPALMTSLARRIAAFHRSAEVSAQGGVRGITRVLEINEQALRAASLFEPERAERLSAAFRAALQRHSVQLETRRKAGKVRRCHGDLILRNICLFEGEPTLFDCLEFDEDLATIDVLYDLAFILMDLWHRDQRDLANLVFNRYLDEADESDGLALVPFFMAVRAAVRAHVTAVQAKGASGESQPALTAEALAYFELAGELLKPLPPIIVAVGGLSGSGKSTVAAMIASALAQAPGARILSSDRLRKALQGVPPEVRLPDAAYSSAISEEVYAMLRTRAEEALAGGSAVVADAVFDREIEREAIELLAGKAGVAFYGFWLVAPLDVLICRVNGRKGDPSDATEAVLHAQASKSCGQIEWRKIGADGVLARIREVILGNITLSATGPATRTVSVAEVKGK